MTELQTQLMEDIEYYMRGVRNIGDNFYNALYSACEINSLTEEVVEEGYWEGYQFYQSCRNIHKIIHEDGTSFYLAVEYSREKLHSIEEPWEYQMESYYLVKPVTTIKWESVQ